MFWNWIVVMTAQFYEYTKPHCVRHFKGVDFMMCELHLNYIYIYMNEVE